MWGHSVHGSRCPHGFLSVLVCVIRWISSSKFKSRWLGKGNQMGVLNSLLPCVWFRGYLGFEGKSAGRILVCVFLVVLKSWFGQGLAPYVFISLQSSFGSNKKGSHLHFNWVSPSPSPHPQHSGYCWELVPDVTPCILVTHTSMFVSLQWGQPSPRRPWWASPRPRDPRNEKQGEFSVPVAHAHALQNVKPLEFCKLNSLVKRLAAGSAIPRDSC